MGRKSSDPTQLYICNRKTEDEHCTSKCNHGFAHIKDECLHVEVCDIINEKVRCRKLTIKELKALNKSSV